MGFTLQDEKISIGPRSQMARIHGCINSLYKQRKKFDFEGTKEDLKNIFKELAVEEGYPYEDKVNKIPKSLSKATQGDAEILIYVINMFADFNNLWLIEYDSSGRKYKSIGGRDRFEMERDFPDIKQKEW